MEGKADSSSWEIFKAFVCICVDVSAHARALSLYAVGDESFMFLQVFPSFTGAFTYTPVKHGLRMGRRVCARPRH